MRFLLSAMLLACGPTVAPIAAPTPLDPVPSLAARAVEEAVVISIVGTNDVHGHVETLASFGGYVSNLRRVRDGAVFLIDGGDMWQGTLPSNLAEGAPVVAAYNLLEYDAATLGNHEFDYGPLGEASTPSNARDDRRGALLARASESRFAMLAANLLDAESGEPVAWEGIVPTTMIERAGVKVGVIGVTTFETLSTTIAANVDDLRVAPLAESITPLATQLREAGAAVVVVAAHAGAECTSFEDPDDHSSCNEDEIVEVANALPEGLVDVIIAGHTHKGIAHRFNGIAVVESFALGNAFSRVDLTVQGGRVVEQRIFEPQRICTPDEENDCSAERYEDLPVEPNAEVAAAVAPAIERAEGERLRSLNVRLDAAFTRDYRNESAAGNLLADLIHGARPRTDLALFNAGGIRADLPAGPLTYGSLYTTFPFDNRFATVRLTGAQLKDVIRFNLMRSSGALLFSGVQVRARCNGEALEVEVLRRGRPIRDNQRLEIVTSDYLATTPIFEGLPEGAITIEDDLIREVLAERLTRAGGRMDPSRYFNADRPRVQLPSARPVRCGASE